MFDFLLLLPLGLGLLLLIAGYRSESRGRMIFGGLLAGLSLFLTWFLDFWGEKLWFDAISYNRRFWSLFFFETGLVVGGALLAALFTTALLYALPASRKWVRYGAIGLAAAVGGLWGYDNWETIMQFWHGVSTDLVDPILGRNTGFYLFTLPFFDELYRLLLFLSGIGLIASAIARFHLHQEGRQVRIVPYSGGVGRRFDQTLFINVGILLLVAAAGKYLDRFHLLYSKLGAVSGPGWTDVNIILPTLSVITIFTALMGILLFIPAARDRLRGLVARWGLDPQGSPLYAVGLAGVVVVVVWLLALTVIPGSFQSFRVEPNEISYEEPFIANNIEFTRHGFNLQQVEDKEFPAADAFTRGMVANNQSIFNNIRLWDWRALDAVLQQFQEIRLYYEFNDVDIDRYSYDGQYRQVMVSAREMEVENLPTGSQTFVNKVFKYTHGYGIALTTVTDFTAEGLPNLLVKNIPPESEYEELAVQRPQIYYGELTDSYVVVNSTEQEFDYPRGEVNEYISYPGTGGVQLSNFWRKLVYAYKMDEFKLLLSSYPTSESRLMFRRQIQERVRKLAPFLEFDSDPYIINADGELYWIIDAYTTSSYFPYSEPFSTRERIQYKEGETDRSLIVQHDPAFQGINYLRNSVKAVVNAFDGSVSFYIFDEEDPVIQVWNKIFPGLMQPRREMPEQLVGHVRYPADYLMMQGLVFAKYHMSDPEVFYNQEDLWIRATEQYYGEVRPVEPYYIMWQLPGSQQAEFSVILPFTPKNRQVLIGWIAGLCDPEHYGRFLAYSFPKEKRVLGPQQVETKIDQNSFLSGQLSLWDQRGSSVIRGNVLAIPVENTLIYVEPIYLQAETAAYPELRLVCVMHDDQLSYAETFDEALAGMFGDAPAPAITAGEGTAVDADASTTKLIRQAKEAFDSYLDRTGQGRFDQASKALDQLQQTLEQLYLQETETTRDTTGG